MTKDPRIIPWSPLRKSRVVQRRRLALSLVPSLFTAGNMAMGFYAILSVLDGRFYAAATAILIGHLLDVLDGRFARWTGSASNWGVEFDSLADWITFGIAPAVIVYELVLKNYGRLGFALALLYVLCAALRLARFNLKALAGEVTAPYFVGLPTPAAGGILAVFVLLNQIWIGEKEARTIDLLMKQVPILEPLVPAIIFLLSLLMISHVRYSTFKNMKFIRPRTVRSFLLMVLVLFMIYVYPQNTIFILYGSYIIWGIGDFVWRIASRARYRAQAAGD